MMTAATIITIREVRERYEARAKAAAAISYLHGADELDLERALVELVDAGNIVREMLMAKIRSGRP